MKKQKVELTKKQKKNLIIIRIVMLVFMYFTVFKLAKHSFDKYLISSMPDAFNRIYNRSKTETIIKAWIISGENINIPIRGFTFPGDSVCHNSYKALEIIANKGGKFTIGDILIAYKCNATNSVKFLEKWLGIDKYSEDDLFVPGYLLESAINYGSYSDRSMNNFKTILENHPELKKYKELKQMIYDYYVWSDEERVHQQKLLSYFD